MSAMVYIFTSTSTLFLQEAIEEAWLQCVRERHLYNSQIEFMKKNNKFNTQLNTEIKHNISKCKFMQAVELMTLSSWVFHWHFLYSQLFETTDYYRLLSFQCWELKERFVFVVVVCKPQHHTHIWRRSKPSSLVLDFFSVFLAFHITIEYMSFS